MKNETKPTKPPRKSRRGCLVAMVIVLLLGVATAYVGYLLALQPVALEGPGRMGTIEIQSGQGVREIASSLEEQGYIRHAWAFILATLLAGEADKLQAGLYELSTTMSTDEIVSALATGVTAMRKVTFPEGYTLEQMASLLEEEGVCATPDFWAAATDTATEQVLGWELPEKLDPEGRVNLAGTAEGYLFPETYLFRQEEDPETVVQAMLEQMKKQFIEPLWAPAAKQKPWGNLHQVITLASLVEREARVDEERALIAGVLFNRLRQGKLLQCDATVQYALGEHKSRLTYPDLQIESPYNTYKHKGLPPSPICNPGLASLKAALHPQQTDYLFYVARPDGTHVFSRTYEEHLAAKEALRGGE